MLSIEALYIFLIGLCVGSFLNVVAFRLPRGMSIAFPPSGCTSCGQKIRPYDNIPILSWLLLKGRCRFCSERISFVYPILELVTGLLFLALYLKLSIGWAFAHGVTFVTILLAASFSDISSALDDSFECGIIPDSIILFGLALGIALSYMVTGDLLYPLKGGAVGFLALFIPSYLYKLVRKREGMGGGDIKLMAVCGAFLGMKSIYFIIFASAAVGAIFGIIWQLVSGRKEIPIPFAPFIGLAAILYLFYDKVIDRFLFGF